MKYCKNCLTPETHDSIAFDDQGVCNVCRQIEYKKSKVDWDERRKWLDAIVEKYKGKGEYDCIVPFSGGKDSVFQLYYIVRELHLRPLVVRYDHWGFRPLIEENNNRVFMQLGVDVLNFKPNWKLVRALMLEGLKEAGDFCWHCHAGVVGHTMQMSVKLNIPLIFWGETAAEYSGHKSFEELNELSETFFDDVIILSLKVDKIKEMLKDRFDSRMLDMYTYPTNEEIKAVGCKPIYLGDYMQWDTKKNVETIKKELGWKGQAVEGIPPEYDYEKIECKWQGMRDFCKYVRRGYGRTSHLVAIDIRNNRLTTEEGRKIVEKYDGKRPYSMTAFLDVLGITETEYYDIMKKHEISPWIFDREKIESGDELPDMKDWGPIL